MAMHGGVGWNAPVVWNPELLAGVWECLALPGNYKSKVVPIVGISLDLGLSPRTRTWILGTRVQ